MTLAFAIAANLTLAAAAISGLSLVTRRALDEVRVQPALAVREDVRVTVDRIAA